MKIICEFGVNWQGLDTFEAMIKECKDIGIRHVKMQMWLRMPDVPKEVHHMYIDEAKAIELKAIADKHKINLFFTPFYAHAVNICESLEVPMYKIRYRDRYRYDLYTAIKNLNKPVLVSTNYYKDSCWKGQTQVKYLYCIPKYPAGYFDYARITPHQFAGYSDHTPDLKLLKRAKKEGFEWFEKHVCWTKDCYEADWSVLIPELEGLVE